VRRFRSPHHYCRELFLIMDEPLGPKRAALKAERGYKLELLPSSVKYAKK
jgi:hypothetical protein